MINEAKQDSFTESFIRAVEITRSERTEKLFSYTTYVEDISPIQFYTNSYRIKTSYRHYWSNPQGLTLVGSGSAWLFNYAGDSNRFQFIKSKWESFVRDHLITRNVPARGILLMGGFCFDATESTRGEWQHFPEASFVLPRFLLTIDHEGCWLTLNDIISPDEENVYQRIMDLREQWEVLLRRQHSSSHAIQYTQQLKVHDMQGEQWKDAVAHAIDDMAHGSLQKIVLSRSQVAQLSSDVDISAVIHRLTEQQPNSYVFSIERQGDVFIGATPERLVKREGQAFYADALAGTTGRGETSYEDEQLGQILLSDKKNLQEHTYVVRMLQDTFQKWCESIEVDTRPTLLKVKDVQHLYTSVKGVAKGTAHLLDVVEQLHPTPAMGGTPRDLAMKRIAELEPHDRGWYSAPIGWMDSSGNGDFSVAIRSGLICGHRAHLYAGCGIVSDSDPDLEYTETQMKFRTMLHALRGDMSND